MKGMIISSLPMPSPISQFISMARMVPSKSSALGGETSGTFLCSGIPGFLIFFFTKEFFQSEFTGILQLRQMLLLKKQQFFSVFLVDEAEVNFISRLFLCKQWQVR